MNIYAIWNVQKSSVMKSGLSVMQKKRIYLGIKRVGLAMVMYINGLLFALTVNLYPVGL